MRVVFAYCVTMHDHLYSRLEKAIAQQRQRQIVPAAGISYIPILISNATYAQHSPTIQGYFGQLIFYSDPFVTDPATGNPAFSLAKFRNVSIDVASALGADWIVLCDCDTFVVRLPSSLPESGYGVPNVYWQKDGAEALEHSIAVSLSGEDVFSRGNSWFMIRRDVFGAFRFNERMYGYGYEDLEFNVRVLAGGHQLQQTDMLVVHLFHPPAITPVSMGRNQRVFEATQRALELGAPPQACRNVAVVAGRHPHWKSDLILLGGEGGVYHAVNGTHGRFAIAGMTLLITWDSQATESFEETAGEYCFVARLF